MALTQLQVIQSLGEALSWFEKEISWGVGGTSQSHLCGRIGELYTAVISNGQMAPEVNQKGYDVVSEDRGRISVKTTAQKNINGHFTFNPNTLNEVDWVVLLKLDVDEMEIQLLFDGCINEAKKLMKKYGDKIIVPLRSVVNQKKTDRIAETVRSVLYGPYLICEKDTGSFEVSKEGKSLSPVKPVLQKIALEIGVDLNNRNENPKNTRQLGASVMRALAVVSSTPSPAK